MKPQDIIKEIAELDGCDNLYVIVKRGLYYRLNAHGYTSIESEAWKLSLDEAKKHEYLRGDEPVTLKPAEYKPYLSSRDAIVPVIEKQFTNESLHCVFIKQLYEVLDCHELPLNEMIDTERSIMFHLLTATPSQLCEALLRATGKWKK